jgi:NTP pyrophosphatase (non-canonical NTP hydrolase)
MERTQITEEQIDLAMQLLKEKLKFRLRQKGYGTFASTHEIAGVVDEEYRELKEAVHYNDLNNFKEELLDVAVGAVFGVACVEAGTLDW